MFIRLLISKVSASNHTKCVLLSRQRCMVEPALVNLLPNEYSQELHYYPFAVNLDRHVGSCNTLNDLCNKAYFPNKTEDLNLSVLNLITGINELKCNSNQKWNNDKCRCECKKHHICEKDYIWNPATCSCKDGKYLASIIDDSVITFYEIIDAVVTKTVTTNFNEKKCSL